jgi:hypothetical protein
MNENNKNYGVIHEIGDYSALRNTEESDAIREQCEKNRTANDSKSSNGEDDDSYR